MTRFADDLETPGGSIGPQLVFYFVYAGDQKAIVLLAYSGGGAYLLDSSSSSYLFTTPELNTKYRN